MNLDQTDKDLIPVSHSMQNHPKWILTVLEVKQVRRRLPMECKAERNYSSQYPTQFTFNMVGGSLDKIPNVITMKTFDKRSISKD